MKTKFTTNLLLALMMFFSSCFLTSCKTPEQKYMLDKEKLALHYKQQRVYQPFSVSAEEGIELKGKTTFTINVPLSELSDVQIPDDLKTVSDLIKWGIGAGLIGYGIHELGGADHSRTVINNNAPTTP